METTRLFPAAPDEHIKNRYGYVVRVVKHPGAVVCSDLTYPDLLRLELAGERRRPAAVERLKPERMMADACAAWLVPVFSGGGATATFTYSDYYGLAHRCTTGAAVLADLEAFFHEVGQDGAYAAGVERHPTGRDVLHAHGLLSGEWDRNRCDLLEGAWRDRRGFARVRPTLDRAHAVAYAVKHLRKQTGDDRFTVHIPRPVFRSRGERRAFARGLVGCWRLGFMR